MKNQKHIKQLISTEANRSYRIQELICEQGGNPHHCNGIGKVESAISTAFYHGEYPLPMVDFPESLVLYVFI